MNDSAQVLEALARAVDGRSSWPDVLVLDLRTSSFAGSDVLSALAGFAELPPTLLVNALPDQSVEVVVSTPGTKQNRRKLELNAALAGVLAAACTAASVAVQSWWGAAPKRQMIAPKADEKTEDCCRVVDEISEAELEGDQTPFRAQPQRPRDAARAG